MTNSIEQLGMQWKEKHLTIVARPYKAYKAGDVVEIISNNGRRWIWRVVEGTAALGTWLDSRGCSEASLWHRISKGNSMFDAKKHAFYSTCAAAVLHGAGGWAYTQVNVSGTAHLGTW